MSKAYRRWKERQKKVRKKYSFSLFRQDVHKTQKFYKDLKKLRALLKEHKPITINSYRLWNFFEEVAAGKIKPNSDYSYCLYCSKKRRKNEQSF